MSSSDTDGGNGLGTAQAPVIDRPCGAELGDAQREQLADLNTALNHALAKIGPGPYQLMVIALGGGVYAAEGAVMLMLSIVAKGLVEKWNLPSLFAGFMATVLFVGLALGTALGGFVCDRYGRRLPVLITYGGISLFLSLALLAPDFPLLIAAKFMLGIFLGFGVPAANAIVAESCPPGHRSNLYCMTMVLFSLGQMYASAILWLTSPSLKPEELQWRQVLFATALLPAGLLGFALTYLKESPHWLLVKWRVTEAQEVLKTMIEYNIMERASDDQPEVSEDLSKLEHLVESLQTPKATSAGPHGLPGGPTEQTPLLVQSGPVATEDSMGAVKALDGIAAKIGGLFIEDVTRVKALLHPSFFLTTSIMVGVTFASNFAYYGMIYGLPDTLKQEAADLGNKGVSPAAGTFLAALCEIPGVFIAIILGMTVGRRHNMTFAFFACATFLVALVYALLTGHISDNKGLAAVMGVKLFLATGYIVVYLYLLECYPTKFRATGLAICMSLGRLGAFLCPFLYDGLAFFGLKSAWFFSIVAVVMGCAAVGCSQLPYETKDAELQGEAAPGERKRHVQHTPQCT